MPAEIRLADLAFDLAAEIVELGIQHFDEPSSLTVGAADVQVRVVTPSPDPSQTWMGFGLAAIDGGQPLVVRFTVTVASVLAEVSGKPPDTFCR
jgi:hypothetical protein